MIKLIQSAFITVLFALILMPSNIAAQNNADILRTDVDLGDRETGQTYLLSLGAQNVDCKKPIDFRFSTETEWIQLPQDSVVRGVPMGETRSLKALIDLTNMAPGEYRGVVELDCENCGVFIFKNCKIDKQQFLFFVNVIPAALPLAKPAPNPPAPAQPAQGAGNNNPPVPAVGAVPEDKKEQACKPTWEDFFRDLERRKEGAQTERDEMDQQLKDLVAEAMAHARERERISEALKAAEKDLARAEQALEDARKGYIGQSEAQKEAAINQAQAERDEAKRNADFLGDEIDRQNGAIDDLEEEGKPIETRKNALDQYLKDLDDVENAASQSKASSDPCPQQALKERLKKAELDLSDNSNKPYPKDMSPIFGAPPVLIGDDTGGGGPIFGKPRNGEGKHSEGENNNK